MRTLRYATTALVLATAPILAAETANHDEALIPAELRRLQKMRCEDGAEPAKLNFLEQGANGRWTFSVTTFDITYMGTATPEAPRYSMEKQVLNLNGKTYFCLKE